MAKIRSFVSMLIHFLVFNTESKSIDYLWTIQSVDNVYVWLNSYVFLKYGNGAKEIGIVLTPRHISKFAVEVLDIKHNDFILDPTCGTGGFLVSAFDFVKQSSTDEQINKFKEFNIFGIESDDDVVALALVNMIFRGDGRNNIREGDCFQKNITKNVKGDIITLVIG